jgi:hypothetical protein
LQCCERDWGLCCSRSTRDALRDERYRVVINRQLQLRYPEGWRGRRARAKRGEHHPLGPPAGAPRGPELIPRMSGGLFLEMLGREHRTPCSGRSRGSRIDRCYRVPAGCLEQSRDLVLRMIDVLEGDTVLLFLIDGTRSVADLAAECGIFFDAARRTVDELRRCGVVLE